MFFRVAFSVNYANMLPSSANFDLYSGFRNKLIKLFKKLHHKQSIQNKKIIAAINVEQRSRRLEIVSKSMRMKKQKSNTSYFESPTFYLSFIFDFHSSIYCTSIVQYTALYP